MRSGRYREIERAGERQRDRGYGPSHL
jgi:hypothetical protein